jgi:hypothetical protein
MIASEKTVYRTKAGAKRKPSWRDRSDSLLPAFEKWPSPESLHPSLSTMNRAISGNQEARAIIAAWNPWLSLSKLVVVEHDQKGANFEK